MKKELLLFLSLLFLTGCASSKLSRTVWHNVTMMQGNGVIGDVGTSLVFINDSTIAVYKGVSIDTTVVISPYIFAVGKYQCEDGTNSKIQVSVSATKRDGNPYTYTGEYNKKNGVMLLNIPNSKMKETYIWDSKAKISLK
jgi:uncharacterized lipoprotein YajG